MLSRLEFEHEIKKLEDEIKKAKSAKENKKSSLNEEMDKLDDDYDLEFEITKDLFSMIPIEQLISNDITKKIASLEEIVRKVEEYLITIDQLYNALTKSKKNSHRNFEKIWNF